MMIMTNAWKSITRSKGRNILIGIIILTIAISASIALAIRSAADKAKETGLAAQTITGTISVDRQKLMESAQGESSGQRPDMEKMQELMQSYSDLTLEELQDYTQSNYVQAFYFTASATLNGSDSFEAYSTTSSSESSNEQTEGMPNMGGFDNRSMGMTSGDFAITSASDEEVLTDFISGDSKITEGEMIDLSKADNQILISSELAAFNELEVGDSVTLTNPNDEDETYKVTIAGVYTNTTSSSTSDFMQFSTAQDPSNNIYMSYETLAAISETSSKNATVSEDENGNEVSTELATQIAGTYVFSDVENYENFDQELREKGLSDYYTLSSSDISSYESSLVPLENLSNFATTFLYVILAVGAVILIVLNIFNIRERKYEVGVLTAIGIKKWKVATQFVVELLVITLTAVIIGAGIGATTSVPISNALLESQITAQESQQAEQQGNFGRPSGGEMPDGMQAGMQGGGGPSGMFGNSGNVTEYIDTVNASIDAKILGQLIGIGLLLTIISSLVGIVFVLRYEPLKILSNRT